jgi:hypothetical protein
MDLLEFGLLWQLCGGRVIRRETADRQDNREPDPMMEKLHLIRARPTPGKSAAASPKLRGK